MAVAHQRHGSWCCGGSTADGHACAAAAAGEDFMVLRRQPGREILVLRRQYGGRSRCCGGSPAGRSWYCGGSTAVDHGAAAAARQGDLGTAAAARRSITVLRLQPTGESWCCGGSTARRLGTVVVPILHGREDSRNCGGSAAAMNVGRCHGGDGGFPELVQRRQGGAPGGTSPHIDTSTLSLSLVLDLCSTHIAVVRMLRLR